MKVLVTGASGFLGRAVVRAAAAAGYNVRALVRPTADISTFAWPDSVEIVRGDLRQKGNWLRGIDVDAVVHLAAAPSGDLATQFAGTVQATENLLESLSLNAIKRFVHVSSFSVYDFSAVPDEYVIDESSIVESKPEARDAYTITKILQERLVTETCAKAGTECIVLRPGAIYGPGKDWDFGKAISFGSYDFIVSPNAIFRLTYVDNCADAIVKAIEAEAKSGAVFNVVDDELPTFKQYYDDCRSAGAPTGHPLPIPWWLLSGLGRSVRLLNHVAFRDRAKLPEILEFRRQQARWKPLRYNNKLARSGLGWSPKIGLQEGISLMLRSGEDAVRS